MSPIGLQMTVFKPGNWFHGQRHLEFPVHFKTWKIPLLDVWVVPELSNDWSGSAASVSQQLLGNFMDIFTQTQTKSDKKGNIGVYLQIFWQVIQSNKTKVSNLSQHEFTSPSNIDSQSILVLLQPTLAVPGGQTIKSRFLIHWPPFWNQSLSIFVCSQWLTPRHAQWLATQNLHQIMFSLFCWPSDEPSPYNCWDQLQHYATQSAGLLAVVDMWKMYPVFFKGFYIVTFILKVAVAANKR